MKPKPKKSRNRKPRAIAPESVDQSIGLFGLTERVSTTRVRLRPDVALGFFSLCHAMAKEHDIVRASMIQSMAKDSQSGIARFEFHRHASAALKMVADRVLKTFGEANLIQNERESRKVFEAAVKRLNSEHKASPKPEKDSPPVPESY